MNGGTCGPGMERRAFVARLTALGAAAHGIVTTACAGFHYVRGLDMDDRIVVRRADLGESSYALVETVRWDRPVYLHREDGSAFTAVLAECTHRRCQPEPAVDRLICPCHGSEFSHDGQVLGGPADRPLPRFEVSEGPDEITIWSNGRSG